MGKASETGVKSHVNSDRVIEISPEPAPAFFYTGSMQNRPERQTQREQYLSSIPS
jgi:hypothetical protein